MISSYSVRLLRPQCARAYPPDFFVHPGELLIRILRLDFRLCGANCGPGVTSVPKTSPSVCPNVISKCHSGAESSFSAAPFALWDTF